MNSTPRRNPQENGVPLLDLQRQYQPLAEEFASALTRVCESGWFVLGPDVKELESRIAEYCQAAHAVGCASGSDALLLALMACDVGPGDEVILPSFTFFATASAVTRLGAKPVFADIDPESYNIAPEHVEQFVGPATKAILPVHLFGQAAEMDRLCDIGREAGVPVVEDAAQAIGAELHGRRVGSLGDIGCFSFYPTKNLGGAGDGGMLTSVREDLAAKLRLLRVHGMEPRYYHQVIGINSRLDSFQAAILNVKMPHLDRWVEMRQENAARYTQLLTESGLGEIVGLPSCGADRRHVWNQYTVRIPNGQRDALRRHLADHKIGAEIYYPLGLHEQECFRYLGYGPGDLPETDRAAEEVLALPIFPELTAEEQEFTVEMMARFFPRRTGRGKLSGPKFLKGMPDRQRA